MGLKILWQYISTEVSLTTPDAQVHQEGILKAARMVARPDTEVSLSHVEKSTLGPAFLYLEMLNDMMIIDKIIQAEKEGYDAALIGCCGDPGLQVARGAVDIPVLGPCESAMLIAQLLGNKFGIVTVGPAWVAIIEANMRRYGFEGRALKKTPVRHCQMGPALIDAFRGKPEELITNFEKEALKCVEDGADVVIAGSAVLGPAFTVNGYHEVANTGVPVVDPMAAALKLAESLADLRRTIGLAKSQCPTSLYQTSPMDMLDQVREDVGFPICHLASIKID